MLIQNLIEDTCGENSSLACEHGLSFYLETPSHKALFDLGASSGFLKNAEKLQIDLTEVDTVVLSHGHNDHGGGLRDFLAVNGRAKVYVQERAFGDYYAASGESLQRIGMDQTLRGHPQLVSVREQRRIDPELFLFSGVAQRQFWPETNANLLMEQGGAYIPDDFRHEQYLAVTAGGRRLLFSGCAHCGIVNIMERYHDLFHCYPEIVVSGMHLTSPRTGKCESRDTLDALARRLSAYPTRFVTCHCTGEEAFRVLRETLGERITAIRTGDIVEVDA